MAKGKLRKLPFQFPTGAKIGKYYIYDCGLNRFYKKGFATLEKAKASRDVEIEHFAKSQQVDFSEAYEIFQRVA